MLKHAGTIEEHNGEDDSTQWIDARCSILQARASGRGSAKQIDIDTFESNLSRCLAMIKIMSADDDVALVDDSVQDR